MASIKEINETFRTELVTAVDGLVDPTDITLRYVNIPEELPAIAYRADIRRVPINDASAAPEYVERDADGYIVREEDHEYMEMRFTVYIAGKDATETWEITENVHRAFHKYSLGGWDSTDFHEDLFDYGIRVESGRPADVSTDDSVTRGETLTINVRFIRKYERPLEHVESANVEVLDAEDSVWATYDIE